MQINDVIYQRRYTVKEAAEVADRILCFTNYDHRETPIQSILAEFGIHIFGADEFDDDISGIMYINSPSCGNCIFTDKNEPFGHQRFVAAHELGHYLFDYVCEPRYANCFFRHTYLKNYSHSEKDRRADCFAAELLMPKDVFVEQYQKILYDERYAPIRTSLFIEEYLANYFHVKKSSVEKRINEIFYDRF